MPKHALQLDRANSNPLFDSWKLASALAVSKTVVTLERHVIVRDHSTDYLNTRAAVLHNHLHQQDQRLLLFTQNAGVSALQEVLVGEHVQLRILWGRLCLWHLRLCRKQHLLFPAKRTTHATCRANRWG